MLKKSFYLHKDNFYAMQTVQLDNLKSIYVEWNLLYEPANKSTGSFSQIPVESFAGF